MSGPSSARNGPIFVFRALASTLDDRSRRDTCSPRDRRAVPNTRRGRHPTGVLSTALGRPRRPNGAEDVPYAPTGGREDAPLPRLRGAEPRVRWRPVGRPLAKKVLVELIMMRGRKCQKLAAIGGDRDYFWGVVASRHHRHPSHHGRLHRLRRASPDSHSVRIARGRARGCEFVLGPVGHSRAAGAPLVDAREIGTLKIFAATGRVRHEDFPADSAHNAARTVWWCEQPRARLYGRQGDAPSQLITCRLCRQRRFDAAPQHVVHVLQAASQGRRAPR